MFLEIKENHLHRILQTAVLFLLLSEPPNKVCYVAAPLCWVASAPFACRPVHLCHIAGSFSAFPVQSRYSCVACSYDATSALQLLHI